MTKGVYNDLTKGPAQHLGSLVKSGSGDAGVFTVWVQGDMVFYGVAGRSSESTPTNAAQADGVVGRIRKFGQQPGAPTIRRLQRHCGVLWRKHSAETDERTARALLRAEAVVRIHRSADRSEADATLDTVRPRLDELLLED